MNSISNPLLSRWWHSQFRLRRIHHSQVILLGIPLVALIGITAHLWAANQTDRPLVQLHWWLRDLLMYFALLFIPICTLFPFLALTSQFRRWDRQWRFEPLLAAPITSGNWFTWLMTKSTLCILVFMLGLWVCLFVHVSHPTIFNHVGEVEWAFYLTPVYIPTQCLWSAAITLHFLSRNRRVSLACIKTLCILAMPPVIFIGLSELPHGHINNDIIQFGSIANAPKIPMSLFLLWRARWSLRDRLIARLSP
jgi:hypothetical protein